MGIPKPPHTAHRAHLALLGADTQREVPALRQMQVVNHRQKGWAERAVSPAAHYGSPSMVIFQIIISGGTKQELDMQWLGAVGVVSVFPRMINSVFNLFEWRIIMGLSGAYNPLGGMDIRGCQFWPSLLTACPQVLPQHTKSLHNAHRCDNMSTKQIPKHSKVLPLGIAKSIPRSWLLCSEVQKLELEITSGNCSVQHQSQGSYPYTAPDIGVSNFSHETPFPSLPCVSNCQGWPRTFLTDWAGNKTNTEMTWLPRWREEKGRKGKRSSKSKKKEGKTKRRSKKYLQRLSFLSLCIIQELQKAQSLSCHTWRPERHPDGLQTKSQEPCQLSTRQHNHWELLGGNVWECDYKAPVCHNPVLTPKSKTTAMGKSVAGVWRCCLPLKHWSSPGCQMVVVQIWALTPQQLFGSLCAQVQGFQVVTGLQSRVTAHCALWHYNHCWSWRIIYPSSQP